MNTKVCSAFFKGGLGDINIESKQSEFDLFDMNKYFENDAEIKELDIKNIIENMFFDSHNVITLDYSDIHSVFDVEGDLFVGVAYDMGKRACSKALEAILNVMPKEICVSEKSSMLINFIGDSKIGIFEVNNALEEFTDCVGKISEVFFGLDIEEMLDSEVYVFCVISGLTSL